MSKVLTYEQSKIFILLIIILGGVTSASAIRFFFDLNHPELLVIGIPLLFIGAIPFLFDRFIERVVFRNLASDLAYHEYLKREKKRKQQIDRLPEDYGRFKNGILMVCWMTVIPILAIIFGLNGVIKIYEGQILDYRLMCRMIWTNFLFIISACVWIIGRSYFRTKYPDYPSRIIPPSK